MRVCAILIGAAALFFALQVELSGQDIGVRDTLRFEPTNPTWTINTAADTMFSVELWGWTDDPNVINCSLPFVVTSSAGVRVDSMMVVDTFIQDSELVWDFYGFLRSVLNTSIIPAKFGETVTRGYNGLLIGTVIFAPPYHPIYPLETSTKVGDFWLRMPDPTQAPDTFTIEIDSSYFLPAGSFKYSKLLGHGFPPDFTGATITVINNLAEPFPLLEVSPDSMLFVVTIGRANPDPQVISIANGYGGTLNWTATDDADWLTLNPESGVNHGVCSVFVDISGMAIDTHTATVTIADPEAYGSPKEVAVTLVILEEGGPGPIFDPDPAYIYYKFAVTPILATVYIGNFMPPYTASDVDASTVAVNDSIQGDSFSILESYPGFFGEVMEITFPIAPFLDGYGIQFDTTSHPFTVSGQFAEGGAFEYEGSVDLIGKRSDNPRMWIVPPDQVVLRGDVDVSGFVDIDDVVATINVIFVGGTIFGPLTIADCNCSHSVDVDDAVYLIDYVFLGGPAPCEP